MFDFCCWHLLVLLFACVFACLFVCLFLRCVVLCCAVLCCVVLCCIVLCCVVLCCVVLCCVVLCCVRVNCHHATHTPDTHTRNHSKLIPNSWVLGHKAPGHYRNVRAGVMTCPAVMLNMILCCAVLPACLPVRGYLSENVCMCVRVCVCVCVCIHVLGVSRDNGTGFPATPAGPCWFTTSLGARHLRTHRDGWA